MTASFYCTLQSKQGQRFVIFNVAWQHIIVAFTSFLTQKPDNHCVTFLRHNVVLNYASTLTATKLLWSNLACNSHLLLHKCNKQCPFTQPEIVCARHILTVFIKPRDDAWREHAQGLTGNEFCIDTSTTCICMYPPYQQNSGQQYTDEWKIVGST